MELPFLLEGTTPLISQAQQTAGDLRTQGLTPVIL